MALPAVLIDLVLEYGDAAVAWGIRARWPALCGARQQPLGGGEDPRAPPSRKRHTALALYAAATADFDSLWWLLAGGRECDWMPAVLAAAFAGHADVIRFIYRSQPGEVANLEARFPLSPFSRFLRAPFAGPAEYRRPPPCRPADSFRVVPLEEKRGLAPMSMSGFASATDGGLCFAALEGGHVKLARQLIVVPNFNIVVKFAFAGDLVVAIKYCRSLPLDCQGAVCRYIAVAGAAHGNIGAVAMALNYRRPRHPLPSGGEGTLIPFWRRHPAQPLYLTGNGTVEGCTIAVNEAAIARGLASESEAERRHTLARFMITEITSNFSTFEMRPFKTKRNVARRILALPYPNRGIAPSNIIPVLELLQPLFDSTHEAAVRALEADARCVIGTFQINHKYESPGEYAICHSSQD